MYTMQNKSVTICACASRSFIDKNRVAEIAISLERGGYTVNIEPDLCKKIMQVSDDLEEIASGTIMACYPRAIRSHFDTLDLKPQTVLDIRTSTTQDILSQLDIPPLSDGEMNGAKEHILKQISTLPVEVGTDAWYPVIDKERCIECGKCHDFCLFGVYTVEKGCVKVVQPQNCKNNCPACARMCPSKAVIFPKYEKSPINGGLEEEEQFDAGKMNAMYNERLRMKLQQRRASVSLLKKDNQ